MNLFIHPHQPLAIVNNCNLGTITCYDLCHREPRIRVRCQAGHFVAACDEDALWLLYKERTASKLADPVYVELWDWTLQPCTTSTICDGLTWIQSCDVTVDHRLLAFASVEEDIALYRAPRIQALARVDGGEYTSGVQFNASGSRLAAFNTFQSGGYVGIYHVGASETALEFAVKHTDLPRETLLEDFADTFGRTAFSADGRSLFVLAANANQGFHDWFADIFCIRLPPDHGAQSSSGTLSCRWITSVDRSLLPDLPSVDEPVLTQIALHPGGQRLAIGLPRGRVLEFDAESGALLQAHRLDTSRAIYAVAYERTSGRLWAMDDGFRLLTVDR